MTVSDAFVQKVADRAAGAIFNALKLAREGNYSRVNNGQPGCPATIFNALKMGVLGPRGTAGERIFNALKIAGWRSDSGEVSRVNLGRPEDHLGSSFTRETRPISPARPGGEGG